MAKMMKLPKVFIPKGVKIVNQKSPMTARQKKFARTEVKVVNSAIKFHR